MPKPLLLFLMTMLAVFGAGADSPDADSFVAKMDFPVTVSNLGELKASSGKRNVDFRFVNSGNAPLVITYLHAACACTRADYPRTPIAPGDSGTIKVVFNPATLPAGDFRRAIVIRTNAEPSKHIINIIGKIRE